MSKEDRAFDEQVTILGNRWHFLSGKIEALIEEGMTYERVKKIKKFMDERDSVYKKLGRAFEKGQERLEVALDRLDEYEKELKP
jgi:hypothetical protein